MSPTFSALTVFTEGEGMSVRSTIMSTFAQVAEERGRTLVPLSNELNLVDCGLDSLGFAFVVAYLEQSLKIDPFDSSKSIDFPVTFGDFVGVYERHGAQSKKGTVDT